MMQNRSEIASELPNAQQLPHPPWFNTSREHCGHFVLTSKSPSDGGDGGGLGRGLGEGGGEGGEGVGASPHQMWPLASHAAFVFGRWAPWSWHLLFAELKQTLQVPHGEGEDIATDETTKSTEEVRSNESMVK
jgi:hypothetical protein